VAGDGANDFRYTWYVPRVTVATNLSFVARVDGSAYGLMMKLDGGLDLNSQMGLGDTNPATYSYSKYRDRRPGDPYDRFTGNDVYLGYENAQFQQRTVGAEKFAARDSGRNQYGSPGSESYQAVIGTAGVTNFAASGSNDWTNTVSVQFAYHDPGTAITASGESPQNHFSPASRERAGTPVSIWVKAGYKFDANKAYVYYTTDGVSFPEGYAGLGIGNTKVAEMLWVAEDTGNSQVDWWRATLPALSGGTTLRYKVGLYRRQDGSGNANWYVPFPTGAGPVAAKKQMLGEWSITGFNALTNVYYPHADYGGSPRPAWSRASTC
jgi:hypothetical protein